jgi:hypothetical protein
MKFCTNCGCQLDDDARFCEECGAKQASIKASASEQPRLNSDVVVNQPDIDTISISMKGIPFNLKLVEGCNYGEASEIADFYIGEAPVTQALWLTVMGDNPSNDITNLEYPVTNISDQLVNVFLLKLSKATGIEFELPTKEQWLRAYHGGNKTKNFKYSGSNDIKKIAWTDGKMHQVAQLYANELGIHDMEGLIREKLTDKGYMKMANINDNNNDKSGELGFRVLINILVDKKFGTDTQLQQLISNHQAYMLEVRKLHICELESIANRQKSLQLEKERLKSAEKSLTLAKKYSDRYTYFVCSDDNGVAISDSQELLSAKRIIISNAVKEIPSGFFKDQTNIVEIVIPSSVCRMGVGVFDGCSNLKNIKFESPRNIHFKNLTRMFANCSSLTDISFMRDVVASDVESVKGMLMGCTNMSDITAISHWEINPLQLFYDDVDFDVYKKDISTVPPHNTPSGKLLKYTDDPTSRKAPNIFYDIQDKGRTLVIVGKGDMPDVDYKAIWRFYDFHSKIGAENITTIIVEEGITSIGNSDFEEFRNLERVFLPKGLKSIGNRAFWNCFTLSQVSLPDGLERIGAYAFGSCALKFALLPDSLKTIGKYAFDATTKLNYIISVH